MGNSLINLVNRITENKRSFIIKTVSKENFHDVTGGNRYANLKNDIRVRIQSLHIYKVIINTCGYVKPQRKLHY